MVSIKGAIFVASALVVAGTALYSYFSEKSQDAFNEDHLPSLYSPQPPLVDEDETDYQDFFQLQANLPTEVGENSSVPLAPTPSPTAPLGPTLINNSATSQPSAPASPAPTPTTTSQTMPTPSFNPAAATFVPQNNNSALPNVTRSPPTEELDAPAPDRNTTNDTQPALNTAAPAFVPKSKKSKLSNAQKKNKKTATTTNASETPLPAVSPFAFQPGHPLASLYQFYSTAFWSCIYRSDHQDPTVLPELNEAYFYVDRTATELQYRFLAACRTVDRRGIPDMASIRISWQENELTELVEDLVAGRQAVDYAAAALERTLNETTRNLTNLERLKFARLSTLVSQLQVLVVDMGSMLPVAVSSSEFVAWVLAPVDIPSLLPASDPTLTRDDGTVLRNTATRSLVTSSSGVSSGNESPMSASGSVLDQEVAVSAAALGK